MQLINFWKEEPVWWSEERKSTYRFVLPFFELWSRPSWTIFPSISKSKKIIPWLLWPRHGQGTYYCLPKELLPALWLYLYMTSALKQQKQASHHSVVRSWKLFYSNVAVVVTSAPRTCLSSMSLGLVSWTAARLVTLLTATSLPWYSASGVNSWSTSVVLVVVSDIVEWTLRRCEKDDVIEMRNPSRL